MNSINERRYVRVKCMTAVRFTVANHTHDSTLRDVSLCGAYVMTETPVKVGARVRIETHLPGSPERTLRLRGRVARCVGPAGEDAAYEREAPGFGVDFAALALSTRTAIEEYVRNTFRVFRRLQFELSRTDMDRKLVQSLIGETYLPNRTYAPDTLKDIVAAELKGFRLRPV